MHAIVEIVRKISGSVGSTTAIGYDIDKYGGYFGNTTSTYYPYCYHTLQYSCASCTTLNKWLFVFVARLLLFTILAMHFLWHVQLFLKYTLFTITFVTFTSNTMDDIRKASIPKYWEEFSSSIFRTSVWAPRYVQCLGKTVHYSPSHA